MNKTAIKNYAIWARVQLIEAAKQKAYEYEITENGENRSGRDMVGGRLLTKTEKEQRNQLFSEINRKGFSQVMEEAAYTWFNRFIALRFMEVNGYLPSKVRVFTDENGAFRPEILKQAVSVDLEGLDRDKVLDLLDRQDNEALYKYLLITQCNALNAGLPYMFEKIGGWTELLFPANLLRQDSVLGQMISEIPEDDWTDAVQIIGWLYQYYNSELKDETFALLKKNVKITKERIPAATQLFTPDWIVRYMVENSLGRLWYEGHPDFDKSQWRYYLDETEQEPEVETQLKKIRAEYAQIKPEDIKVIDPCMGSGHILVYAFDVLMQIYTSAGWSERDAAKSILENNLYGLDIDDRAGQLAYFAVMMKARKHSRRILNGEVTPNVLSILDSNWMTDEFISYVAGKDANMKADLVMLRKTFKDAKEYGSILNIPTLQYDALYDRFDIISRSFAENLFQAQYKVMAIEQLLPLVKQSQIMSQKYDVVVTNPPYMGSSGMSGKLGEYVKTFYPDSKSDLFSCFIEKSYSLAKEHGIASLITMESWMFLASFEKLRQKIGSIRTITNMVHMPYLGKGGTSLGINFGTCAFVLRNYKIKNYTAQYEYTIYTDCDSEGVPLVFPTINKRWSVAKQENFEKIPGAPIAYWLSQKWINPFDWEVKFSSYIEPRIGLITGDNNRFLRLWFEVNSEKIAFTDRTKKWFPYSKGGDFQKWYGNLSYVVNWENDGHEMRSDNFDNGRLRAHNFNGEYAFNEGISWSSLTSGEFSCRYQPEGLLFDAAGPLCKVKRKENIKYVMSFLLTKISRAYLKVMNPTINMHPGYLLALPFKMDETTKTTVDSVASECIHSTKIDWDSYETSWDFKKHPLI